MVSLFELLNDKAAVRILAYFLGSPGADAYAAQLAKKVKVSRRSLFAGLSLLVAAGLLRIETIGRVKKYSLAVTPAVRQLKILFTIDRLSRLGAALAKAGARAYLYGSAARGENAEHSDIDVLVISDRPKSAIAGLLETGLQKEVKLAIMTPLEYASAARKDPAFYARVEADKIELC